MKNTIKSALILSIIFLLSSCLKENHSVRLKNNYSVQINNIVVGNAELGNVASGASSEYKSINTGDFSISGKTSTGLDLTGSGTISGKGTHKWTITVTSSGGINFAEDK